MHSTFLETDGGLMLAVHCLGVVGSSLLSNTQKCLLPYIVSPLGVTLLWKSTALTLRCSNLLRRLNARDVSRTVWIDQTPIHSSQSPSSRKLRSTHTGQH